ncbi:armadillo-type protein [Schizophyllum fasciatum]
MASSLAAQLAANASLNSNLLVDRSKRKPTQSYLFTGRDADNYDLDSVHALAVNGFRQLATLTPQLRKYEDTILSPAAKATDRTLLSAEADGRLNESLKGVIAYLGEHLLTAPAGKVIEWLVRRFRVHEFNVEDALALFLPYLESPHFTKMLSILNIQPSSTWAFLLPFKASASRVPRAALVAEMRKNSVVARFLSSLVPTAIQSGTAHQNLVKFNVSVLREFIAGGKTLDEGAIAHLLQSILAPLQYNSSRDAVLGSYILLASLSHKVQLPAPALKSVVASMASSAHHVEPIQLVTALVSVCGPQETLASFSRKTAKQVLALKGVEAELVKALQWEHGEKVVVPLLAGSVDQLDNHTDAWEAVLTSANGTITAALATILVRVVKDGEDYADAARTLLAVVYQRHPESLKGLEGADSVLLSISSTGTSGTDDDMALASTDANGATRVAAVAELIARAERDELPESATIALLARVADDSADVLDTLYSRPEIVTPILLAEKDTYLSHLTAALDGKDKVDRHVLVAHVNFLAGHFAVKADPQLLDALVKLLFPHMLYTKSRQRSAEAVWKAVAASERLSKHPLLIECGKVWEGSEEKKGGDAVERMARTNLRVADKMADNIIMSDEYTAHLEFLLASLQGEDASARLLAGLVAIALLRRMSGEHQVSAAHRILEAVENTGIANGSPSLEIVDELAKDEHVAKLAVQKTKSATTALWLHLAIIKQIAAITRPANIILDWLTILPSRTADTRGTKYVNLMRSTFRVASGFPSFLAASVFRQVFDTLQDESLAFLAGVWDGADPPLQPHDPRRMAALALGKGYLEARLDDAEPTDFQAILPSLLVAVQTVDAKLAFDVLKVLRRGLERKFTSKSRVYGLDTIYGPGSGKLQYLEQDDLKQYLDALLQHEPHFLRDAKFGRDFHHAHLAPAKGDKKKVTEYKHRVLCFLLSHVDVFVLPQAQIALLSALELVPSAEKATILRPTIRSLVRKVPTYIANVYGDALETFTALVVASFDASSASSLSQADSELWPDYVQTINQVFSGCFKTAREAITRSLEQGLFKGLSSERQIQLCEALLEMEYVEDVPAVHALLSKLLVEVPLINQLLINMRPADATTSPRAKKQKIAGEQSNTLARLTMLAEVLAAKGLPGSLDLVACLLETLGAVVHSPSSGAEVGYIVQLLMSSIGNAAGKVTSSTSITSGSIRIEVLVDVIRSAPNPQTFHQALLLMAELTHLAPEAILRNVMPVFTFMGSNVFHRDDTYSFRVIQKTVDMIVPVMADSLRKQYTDRLELYIGAREFLRVFTDAASHIPRHRRVSFFTHLLQVLKPEDFLAPVCMLLVERVTNRAVKQKEDEARSSLYLPLTLLHHFSVNQQITALTEIVHEARRLLHNSAHLNDAQPNLLDWKHDDEQSSATVLFQRRAKALIIFAGFALKSGSIQTGDKAVSELLAALLSLSVVTNAENLDDISAAARQSLERLLSVMPAADFVSSTEKLLQPEDDLIRERALRLLSERMDKIADKIRRQVAPYIIRITKVVHSLIVARASSPVAAGAFEALRAICETVSPGEEAALLECVQPTLVAIRERKNTLIALTALAPLLAKLGPRAIPFLRETVALCTSILRNNEADLDVPSVAVLQALLSSIPAFWSSNETSVVLTLVLDCPNVPFSASLGKAVVKRLPAKALVAALLELWDKVSGNTNRLCGYFNLLKRAYHKADRVVVIDGVREALKRFTEGLEIVATSHSAELESALVAAFIEMVVKLNEAAFRPIFRKLYDWAFTGTDDGNSKRVTFCHLYIALLDYFRGLMNPYMTFMIPTVAEYFGYFSAGALDDTALWGSLLELVAKSLSYDDGSFWREAQLRKLAKPLVEQVPVCVSIDAKDGRRRLRDALMALVETSNDDVLLKSINLDLLMHTRSEEAPVRLVALECAEALWRNHGGKLLGFASETATFVAETSEDENDAVVRESLKLKDALEAVAGRISGL